MMSDPNPKCSIVIRAFNEERHIGRLLAGIMQQSIQDIEIILVDSGSTDATLAIAARYPVKVVSIDPETFTFGRSLNLGCAQARGDYLVFASAHVYPLYEDWLETLIAPFEDETVALVYGKQSGGSSSRYSEHQIFASWFPDHSIARQSVAFCNNANAAVRRSLWKLQSYDEDLPGLEDLDWAHWAMGEGYFISYAAAAEIVHVHEEVPRQVLNRYRREAIALQRILPDEKFSTWDLLRLYLSNVLSDAWHAQNERRLSQVWSEILWFRWMQFWGTYRGFRYSGPTTKKLIQTFYYPRARRGDPRAKRSDGQPIDYSGVQSEEQ
jgi:rhamnosyltransferase